MSMPIICILLGVCFLVFSHRFAWWRKTVSDNCPRILMYHMVSEHVKHAKFNKMRVTPANFEQQLKWLSEQGFTFFTMQELYDSHLDLPPKSVVLTFDDGFADNLHNALPLLKKYGAKATIYVVTDRHERDWDTYKKAHHNSGELAREPKLTDAELLTLANSGIIEIGSHSCTHLNMLQQPASVKAQELSASKKILMQQTAQPIHGFAYPFGLYDAQDVRLVKEAGYLHAVTVQQGIDDVRGFSREDVRWLMLKRIKVSGKDSLFAFKTRIRTGLRGWK